MIYIRVPEILRVDIVSSPELLNRDEVVAAGVHKLRSVATTIDFSRDILYGLYDAINGRLQKTDKDKFEKMLVGLLANNADEIVRGLGILPTGIN